MVFRGLVEQGQAALNASRAVELSGAPREQKRLAWRRRLATVESYRHIMDGSGPALAGSSACQYGLLPANGFRDTMGPSTECL